MILPHMNPISPFGYPVVEVVPVAALVVFVLEKVKALLADGKKSNLLEMLWGAILRRCGDEVVSVVTESKGS